MVPRAPLHSSRRARLGGGIAELIPDELVNSGAGRGMELEKLGHRKWWFHGTPTDNWLVAGAPIHLEPGTYLFSGTASDPGGQNGGLIQIFRKAGSYVQITPVNKSSKTFEVAEAADVRFELLTRLAGNPIDLTATASLIRIGDAGGGIANLVGSEDGLEVFTTKVGESIEVTADGVRYAVTNSWSGCFFVYSVAAGTYRVDRGGADAVLASVRTFDSFTRNDYYSGKAGTDIYSSRTYGGEIALPEDGKIGFVIPQGEGVIHPSIVRVL